MATCDRIAKGNVVSWELSNQATGENIAAHNVVITEFTNPTLLCNVLNLLSVCAYILLSVCVLRTPESALATLLFYCYIAH